eukprot:COSAG02_NODE_65312_length_258_cov_0.716981_1_plen_64_part_10
MRAAVAARHCRRRCGATSSCIQTYARADLRLLRAALTDHVHHNTGNIWSAPANMRINPPQLPAA